MGLKQVHRANAEDAIIISETQRGKLERLLGSLQCKDHEFKLILCILIIFISLLKTWLLIDFICLCFLLLSHFQALVLYKATSKGK